KSIIQAKRIKFYITHLLVSLVKKKGHEPL
ncbi:MAG: hypothetical protein ACI85F_002222, partial [Bacteroidia bacterium]